MTIKELRQMKGLTLAAFAESIGIGMSTLTRYEAGKRQPSEKALAAIKEVYGGPLLRGTRRHLLRRRYANRARRRALCLPPP